MIVQIQGNDTNDGTPEWALLELNGELVAPTEVPRAEIDENRNDLIGTHRVELGSLRFTPEVNFSRCIVSVSHQFIITHHHFNSNTIGQANHGFGES